MLKAIAAWGQRARWHASVLHLGEMWLVWIPAFMISESRSGAFAAVAAFYWAVKRTEVRLKLSPGFELAAWADGWTPGEWLAVDPYLLLDWALPTLTAGIIALA